VRHVFEGTKADNAADASAKGRLARSARRGDGHPKSKLTEVAVIEIRRRLATGDIQSWIAADFFVSQSAIAKIATGKTWRNVK
jgi:hypothetical protein